MMLRRVFPMVLVAMVCVGACAVGSTIAAASTGSPWIISPSPSTSSTQSNDLNAVSCITPTACVAVGSYYNGTNDQTLAEMWDGSSWTIVPSPNTSSTLNNLLDGVSCTSMTACVAVGYANDGTNNHTLVELWNGTAWTVTPSPDDPAAPTDFLNDVSCSSASSCVAVGSSESNSTEKALILMWNGTAWAFTASPNIPSHVIDNLEHVSCTSPTACMAVGYSYGGVNDQTLVEVWDGSAWTYVASPNPSATQFNFFDGVSCTSATNCVAVGGYGPKGDYETLVESWNGSAWSIVASPNPSPTQNNRFNAVSCTSTTACVAVGSYSNGANDQTLVEVWDGSAWTVTASPVPSVTQDAFLAGVSCTAPTACIASGSSNNGTDDQTLVLSGVTPGGYRLAASDGGVFAYGSSPFFGSAGAIHLNKPVVGMVATPDDQGYWLVATDGGVFSYGDAGFYGSTGAITLNRPIVGMAATADGKGYWLVASDGGVFAYGDAAFCGSMGGSPLNKPIVGMARTNGGKGYWLVATDGGVFAFGDATFSGSTGAQTLAKPIVGMAASPIGTGYWLVASDGGIFSYGGAAYLGSTGAQSLTRPIVGMTADQTGHGYWLAASGGGVFAFGDAPALGNQAGFTLTNPIVGITG